MAHCTVLYMSDTLPITEARGQFGSLVRRASTRRERITITDHGVPAAVLINAQELADLEDDLAIAQYRAEQAAGTLKTTPNGEVRARLGLSPA
jgi:prevent-host-death family protein